MKKNNKITFVVMLLAAVGFLLQSCGKDSKVPYPPSRITGSITYQGQPVRLMSTNNQLNSGAGNNQNLNTLWLRQTAPQPLGLGDMRVIATNDGTFTVATFDGDYTILPNTGRAPYQDFTPISFKLSGTYNVNIPVTPYFWVTEYQTTFVDSVFTATFKLNRLVPTATFNEVRLYFSTTNKADASANIFSRGFSTAQGINFNGTTTNTISVNLKAMSIVEKQDLKARGNKLWVNMGVRITGVSDALYQQSVALR